MFWVISDIPDTSRMAREWVEVENVGDDSLELYHANIDSTAGGFYVEASRPPAGR